MTILSWESRYRDILKEFGYSRKEDSQSCKLLNLLLTKKTRTTPIKNLKEIGMAIQSAKSAIEQEDVSKIIDNLELFIEPTKCGQEMIEEFLEEHREIRLYKVRLNDKGVDFVIDNKRKMLEFFENLEIKVTKKLRTSVPQN